MVKKTLLVLIFILFSISVSAAVIDQNKIDTQNDFGAKSQGVPFDQLWAAITSLTENMQNLSIDVQTLKQNELQITSKVDNIKDELAQETSARITNDSFLHSQIDYSFNIFVTHDFLNNTIKPMQDAINTLQQNNNDCCADCINRTTHNADILALETRISALESKLNNQTTPPPVTEDLTTGLVAYYKLDGDLADSLGRFNLINVEDVTAIASGKINSAYNWTINGQYLKAQAMNVNAPLTINLWFRSSVDFTAENYGYIFRWANAPYSGFDLNCFYGYFANDRISCYVDDTSGEPHLTSVIIDDASMDNGQWHMLTLSLSTSNMTLYLDGVLRDNSNPGGIDLNNNDDLVIGGALFRQTQHWMGAIDEFGVWNRVLIGSEVTKLYNNGAGMSYPFN